MTESTSPKPQKQPTKAEITNELIRVAKRYDNEYFQKRQFTHYAKHISSKDVTRAFGSWNKALREIGVTEFPEKPKRVKRTPPIKKESATYNSLLVELVKKWMELGHQPSAKDWETGFYKYSVKEYIAEFGSWENALEEAKSMPESVENELYPDLKETPLTQSVEKNHKRTIPENLTQQVLTRAHNRCSSCGKVHTEEEGVFVKVVYIKAPSKGGRASLSNLKTLCNFCIDASKQKKRWY